MIYLYLAWRELRPIYKVNVNGTDAHFTAAPLQCLICCPAPLLGRLRTRTRAHTPPRCWSRLFLSAVTIKLTQIWPNKNHCIFVSFMLKEFLHTLDGIDHYCTDVEMSVKKCPSWKHKCLWELCQSFTGVCEFIDEIWLHTNLWIWIKTLALDRWLEILPALQIVVYAWNHTYSMHWSVLSGDFVYRSLQKTSIEWLL